MIRQKIIQIIGSKAKLQNVAFQILIIRLELILLLPSWIFHAKILTRKRRQKLEEEEEIGEEEEEKEEEKEEEEEKE